MPNKILVFHSPWPTDVDINAGSKLRPLEMKRALERLDIDIIVVDGYSNERKKSWEKVDENLANIIGLYSELRTIPLALSDSDHIPRHPAMDLIYFRKLQKQGIPTTAFYRDIYWRFPFYSSMLPLHKRLPTLLFYYLEFYFLKKYLSHIFVPSLRIAEHFPLSVPSTKVSALPPGCDAVDIGAHQMREHPLNLFYVGGILPPVYSFHSLLSTLSHSDDVNLTLCFRKDEWDIVRSDYQLPNNVTVIHESGNDVIQRLSTCDALIMYWDINPYMEFAMPIKLFQALGLGVPIITNSFCDMGDFVRKENIGWALDSTEELAELLSRISKSPLELKQKRDNAKQRRWSHTWDARAKDIVDVVEKISKSN